MNTTSKRFSISQLLGSNFSFQHLPFEAFAEEMAGYGVTRIELWGIAPHLDLFHATPRRVREVGRILEAYDLTLHCFTPEQVVYPINIASGDDELRHDSLARFLHAAQICAELGGSYLFLTAGRSFESEPSQTGWGRSVDGIGTIAEYAASLGLRCLLEPLQRHESNIILSAHDLRRMLGDVGCPNIDVVLDLVAMSCAGDDIRTYVDLFGSRIRHVHLVDGTPTGHLAWKEGTLPLDRFMQELAMSGYSGTFAFEPFGDGSYALEPQATWARNRAAVSPWFDSEEEHS